MYIITDISTDKITVFLYCSLTDVNENIYLNITEHF